MWKFTERLCESIHYSDFIMSTMASQITSLTVVYSTVHQRKHQSPVSLPFVWGIHRWPVNSPHKRPVTRKMLPFDDVIMIQINFTLPRGFATLFWPCTDGAKPDKGTYWTSTACSGQTSIARNHVTTCVSTWTHWNINGILVMEFSS